MHKKADNKIQISHTQKNTQLRCKLGSGHARIWSREHVFLLSFLSFWGKNLAFPLSKQSCQSGYSLLVAVPSYSHFSLFINNKIIFFFPKKRHKKIWNWQQGSPIWNSLSLLIINQSINPTHFKLVLSKSDWKKN